MGGNRNGIQQSAAFVPCSLMQRSKPLAKIHTPLKFQLVRTADDTIVWEGSQKNLFRKYASRRNAAIKEITANLQKLASE